jgi:hypothetical protein
MRARELAITYPSPTPDALAAEATRLLAAEALLPAGAAGLAEVDGDATLLVVATALAQTGVSLVVVHEDGGRLLGGITTSRLICQLLGAE